MFVLIYSIGSAGQIIRWHREPEWLLLQTPTGRRQVVRGGVIGTGTLVRYLSRISGTYPYESDGITINSQRLNFLFLQACGF